MGSDREVDLQGNCSKCGGVHFGTGPDCVYGKPVQNSTIPPTLQTGREQPQGEATRAQTEGGEKPCKDAYAHAVGDCSCPHGNYVPIKPSSPPATAAEKCGQPAASFIPRWGMSFACVLPKGHDGDHKQGGNCVKHGDYIGAQCPNWPTCIPAPPATAGTARELRSKSFSIDPAYLPAIDEHMTVVSLVDAEAYADQRVRSLQTSLAKLYAAIGPMDELDTVDDAVARVAQLRQERDALRKELDATTNSN